MVKVRPSYGTVTVRVSRVRFMVSVRVSNNAPTVLVRFSIEFDRYGAVSSGFVLSY